MALETQKMLEEVEAEISRLTRLRDALREASGKSEAKGKRISSEGIERIRTAAKLRHAERRLKAEKRNPQLRAEVATLQAKLRDLKSRARDAWRKDQ